jgi:WD40 repeat protein
MGRTGLEWTGRALALGVEGPRPPGDSSDLTPFGFPDRLTYAPSYAEELRAVLRDFDYAVEGDDSADLAITGSVLANSVKQVLEQGREQRDSAVIVHVLSHGTLDEGTRHLYTFGNDGSQSPDHVETWLGYAQDVRGDTEGLRPHALFILDICYSGAAAQLPWLEFVPTAKRKAWVIAACGPSESAYNGRLTSALIDTLRKYNSRELRADSRYRYIPLDTFIRAVVRRIGGLYDQESERDGIVQHPEISNPGILDASIFNSLPFFVNRSWNPHDQALGELISRMPPESRAFLDAVPDFVYFMDRAAGGNPPGGSQQVGFFQGRVAELQSLVAWLGQADSPLKVVTGKPGVGKSALLGILACTAHPGIRAATQPLWNHLSYRPPVFGERFCALHARLRTLEEITTGLARQLGLAVTGDIEQLVTELTGLDGDRPVVLVDAVDEARDPQALASLLLLRLVRARRSDGTPACRLLIGCRPNSWLDDLTKAAGADCAPSLDLGAVDPGTLLDELTGYLNRVIQLGGDYASAALAPVGEHLAETVAGLLVGEGDHGGTPDWGEFLVAVIFAHHVLRSEPAANLAEAEALAKTVPRDLPGVLQLDLSRRASPWMRPVLAAVAHALGDGMPEPLIELAAQVMRPRAPGPAPTSHEIHDVLDTAEFYLRRSVDRGDTLYRVFHQTLSEWLRKEPWEPSGTDGASAPNLAGPLYEALVSPVVKDGAPGAWGSTWSYLIRHASEHAAAAGRLDELLIDPEFLVHADPEILAQQLHHARSEAARQGAGIHRASYFQHHEATPDVRRQILAVDAARFGQPEWADKLSGPSKWRVRWATGGQVSASLLVTQAGHKNRVQAVSTVTWKERPTAVTVDADGVARAWDIQTGQVADSTIIQTGKIGRVNGVVSLSSAAGPLVVTAGEDHTITLWNLTPGQVDGRITLRGHDDAVNAVDATVTAGGRPVIVSVSRDETARVWSLDSGKEMLAFTEHADEVNDVACTESRQRTVAVTVSTDGTGRVWDVETGEEYAVYEPGVPLRGVACIELGGRPVAVSTGGDKTVRVWEIETGDEIAVFGHTAPLRGVACIELGGRPVAVSTSDDGTAQVWDLEGRERIASLGGHTDKVTAVACTEFQGRVFAVTTSDDRTARVWDLTAGQRIPPLSPAHTGTVTALALASVGEGSVVISGSDDGTVRLWDAVTGDSLDRLPGPGNPVTSVDATAVGDRLVVTSTANDQTGRIWVVGGDRPQAPSRITLAERVPGPTTGTCVTRNDTPILVTTSNLRLQAWDLSAAVTGGEPVSDNGPLTGHRLAVNAATRTQLGGRPLVVTVSGDTFVRLWDPVTSKSVGQFQAHVGPVQSVACATWGSREVAVTGGDDGARVWDLESKELLAAFDGHGGPVVAVTCSVTANVLTAFTASGPVVYAWDVASQEPVSTFTFPYPVHALCAGAGEEIVVAMGWELAAVVLTGRGQGRRTVLT